MLRSNYRTRRRLSFVCALLRTESKQYTPCRAIAQTNLNVQTCDSDTSGSLEAWRGLRVVDGGELGKLRTALAFPRRQGRGRGPGGGGGAGKELPSGRRS